MNSRSVAVQQQVDGDAGAASVGFTVLSADHVVLHEQKLDVVCKLVAVKIAGLDTEAYQIALERAHRLISRADANQTLADIKATGTDRREHDIQCALLRRYIVLDWKGDIADPAGSSMAYSPENAERLLAGDIDFFSWVIPTAARVTTEQREEVKDTMGKSSRVFAGSARGRAGCSEA